MDQPDLMEQEKKEDRFEALINAKSQRDEKEIEQKIEAKDAEETPEVESDDKSPEPEKQPPKDTDQRKPIETKTLAKVEVSESGFLVAKTLEARYRIATAFLRGGMVPKSYQTPESVLVGMEFALELGLRPLTGLRNIAVINGSPSIWGELPLGLCKKHGAVKKIREFIIDKDYNEISFSNKNLMTKPWAAICQAFDAEGEMTERFFTLEDAKAAGLIDKKGDTWKKYLRRMLQMRARSHALKDCAAEILSGVSIAEYDRNYFPERGEPEFKDVTHSGKEKLNGADMLSDIAKKEGTGNEEG